MIDFFNKNNVEKPECFGDLSKEPYPCWIKQVNVCINCEYNEECRKSKTRVNNCDFEIPRVKITSPQNTFLGTKYYIDDKQIKKCTGIDFRIEAGEIPTFTFEIMGQPEIEMFGDVRFSFTPETVKQASVVLRNELLKHGDFYKGFRASIVTAIKDSNNDIYVDEMAKNILKRIIGEE